MKFVVFETNDGVWVTTPENKYITIVEMQGYGVDMDTVTEKRVSDCNSLLIKAYTGLVVDD